jgi:hypothetical protein
VADAQPVDQRQLLEHVLERPLGHPPPVGLQKAIYGICFLKRSPPMCRDNRIWMKGRNKTVPRFGLNASEFLDAFLEVR